MQQISFSWIANEAESRKAYLLPYIPTVFGPNNNDGTDLQLGNQQVVIKAHVEIAPGLYELPKAEMRDRAGLIHICGSTDGLKVQFPVFQMSAIALKISKQKKKTPSVQLKEYVNKSVMRMNETWTPYRPPKKAEEAPATTITRQLAPSDSGLSYPLEE